MNLVLIGQIVTGILVIGAILLQNHGGGLGPAFGGTSYHTKRGLEKGVFVATIVLTSLFTVLSIVALA